MAYLVMSSAKIAGAAVVLAMLAGCTKTSAIAPLSFGPVTESASATAKPAGSDAILEALNGGILPQDAASTLSRAERLRALEAEYQALEKTPGGQSVAWASPVGGASGEVKAGTPYQVGQQNCRQYTHSVQIKGTVVTGRGAACRNADGSWTPLS
ncbi:RT0821/Lpp0805 family surface protein [Hoeflea sp.]|uniref:RT0821/Lpp0805 family surface protein n=1 Tax=Hoeflea sp. TaxID=1940281 RepID=UPI0037486D38